MMRGRQIGTWIGNREAGGGALDEADAVDKHPRRSLFWRNAPVVLLVIVIVAVSWWVRREGAYRRFISDLRAGKVQYVEFQPYPDSAFVRVDEERRIAGVVDWLKDARPMDRRFASPVGAVCEMRIAMTDGSIRRLWIGQTGPVRSGGTLVPSNAYVTVKGDGWERVAFSNGLSNVYTRLPISAQLPFSSIPIAPTPVTGLPMAATLPAAFGEVDCSIAQNLLERGQLGQARRVLARAVAGDPSNGMASQFMPDVEARIRIRLPQAIKELENQLPANGAVLEREKYLQLREKLLEILLMAKPGDKKVAELRQRLKNARPAQRVEDFKEVLRLGGAEAERYSIRDFAWSPDGATIATCGDDGRVRVWDTINGELLESFPAAVGTKIYFSADGQRVWVWNDAARSWWDVVSGKASDEAKVAEDPKPPYRLNMADSDIVSFSFSKDGVESFKQLPGHAGLVRLAKFSPDGDQLASFADDKVLSIWGDGAARGIADLSPYERLRRVRRLDGASVFLEDGSILTFKKSGAGGLRKDALKTSFVDLPSPTTRVNYAARNQRLLVEMANGNLTVVQPDVKKVYPINKPKNSCGRAGISPDGKTIAIGNIDGSVKIINVDSNEIAANLICSPTRNRNWTATDISFDGGWVMACGVGFVSVWNTQTREQVFYTEKAAIEGVAAGFTTDGKGMAIIYKDGGLRMLRSSLKESEAVGFDIIATREPAFSKDGRWVASIVKGGEVEIFDSSSAAGICRVAVKVSTKSGEPMRFNDDGSVLLVKADDGSVRLVDVPSGRELRRLTVKDEPNWLQMPCSFNADGKSLVAGPMLWGVE